MLTHPWAASATRLLAWPCARSASISSSVARSWVRGRSGFGGMAAVWMHAD